MTKTTKTIAFELAELTGGPFHGQRFKVHVGPIRLMLTTRPKRHKHDKPPTSVYERACDVGHLRYVGMIGTRQRAS